MDSKSLRIGNLVTFNTEHNIPTEIKALFRDGVDASSRTKLNYNQIFPIYLETEWFEKLGFEWNLKRCTYSLGDFHLTRWQDNEYMIAYDGDASLPEAVVVTLDYVHQLQNLYYSLKHTDLIFKQHEQSN